MQAQVAIINYHYCHPPGATFTGLKGVTPDELDAHLTALAGAGISVRRMQDVLTAPPDHPCAVLTFDDGLKDLKDYALPILEKHGVSASFFVSSRPYISKQLLDVHRVHLLQGALGFRQFEHRFRLALAEIDLPHSDDNLHSHLYPHDNDLVRAMKIDLNYRLPYSIVGPLLQGLVEEVFGDETRVVAEFYLTPDEIRECIDAGHEVGLHSHSHRVMSRLSVPQQREEVCICREFCTNAFGVKSFSFSYPYGVDGTYNDRTVKVLSEDPGVIAGFTLARKLAEPEDFELCWRIPRLDNRDVFGFDGRLRLEVIKDAFNWVK